ncbi:hypothetical protein FKB34_02345 [Glycocaulis profundi]|nr:hypothetical protein FKB34_02345 [Glycocaulis profundi]
MTDTPPAPPPSPEPARPRRRGFFARLVDISGRDVIVLLVLCLCAGVVLAAFNVDPSRLWVDFFGTLGDAWERAVEIVTGLFGWSFRYFVLGAVLVVPLWILWRVIRATGRER